MLLVNLRGKVRIAHIITQILSKVRLFPIRFRMFVLRQNDKLMLLDQRFGVTFHTIEYIFFIDNNIIFLNNRIDLLHDSLPFKLILPHLPGALLSRNKLFIRC